MSRYIKFIKKTCIRLIMTFVCKDNTFFLILSKSTTFFFMAGTFVGWPAGCSRHKRAAVRQRKEKKYKIRKAGLSFLIIYL
jgi:hypothetical protein